jgi:hypothetical protein
LTSERFCVKKYVTNHNSSIKGEKEGEHEDSEDFLICCGGGGAARRGY